MTVSVVQRTAGPCRWDSRALDRNLGAGTRGFQRGRVSFDHAEQVNGAGRSYFTSAAGRGGAEEEAERSAWRPIADGAEFHGFPYVLLVCDLIGELGGKDDDALFVADQYVTWADQVSSA